MIVPIVLGRTEEINNINKVETASVAKHQRTSVGVSLIEELTIIYFHS